MTRAEALKILRREKPRLMERYGVRRIGLFGSVARNEGGPESDVDVIVDMPMVRAFDFFHLVDEVEKAFPVKVDVIRWHPNLRPNLREAIAKDVVYA